MGKGYSFRSHFWGHDDSFFKVNHAKVIEMQGSRYGFSGKQYPRFIPYIKEVLGVDISGMEPLTPKAIAKVPDPVENRAFVAQLKKHLKPDQIDQEPYVRLKNSHGQTTCLEVYKIVYHGIIERVVDLVVYPESEEDASRIIASAHEHNVCLVPYGGGTNVTSALQLPTDEPRMIVSVDMRRMDKIEWLNEENKTACIQAGIRGQALEDALAKEGYVLGHQPDSMEFSTLGGWISTNASGMKKNRYGNIEDIVDTVYMITPMGLLHQKEGLPRTSMGMKPQSLVFGSEGNLGLITKAVVKIHQLPEETAYESLVFRDFKTGVRFIKKLSQSNYIPASFRLVDNFQLTFGRVFKEEAAGLKKWQNKLSFWALEKLKGFDLRQVALGTIVMEGTREEVSYQKTQLNKLAKQFGAVPAGGSNGKSGYNLTFMIAYIRDFLFEYRIIGDTLETSVPFEKIEQVISAVEQCYHQEYASLGIRANPYISYRIPQIYHTGVCIYFMFGIYTAGLDKPDEVFAALEHKVREVIIDNGGAISHHHGVGKLRKDFMPKMLSKQGVDIVKGVKHAADPTNVFGIKNNVFALKDSQDF